jgi:hypothetical protein
MGTVAAIGTISTTVYPLYSGFLERQGINVMVVFIFFAILGIGAFSFLPETFGKELK